jgi:hypothetical protein
MRINRTAFLSILESVSPGLSAREFVEQSHAFAFRRGYVYTFNDEVACKAKSTLPKDFEGAVVATKLLAMLRKNDRDDEIEVVESKGELRLIGKRWKSAITMEDKIHLPIELVEKPETWKPLHEDFNDALMIVQECAGKDASQFILTCVHLHPKWLEATDNIQMIRYRIRTEVDEEFLVRRDSIKNILNLGMTEFSETKAWVHFRNPSGIVLSARRHVEEYPDFGPELKVEGEPATLPKGLVESVDCAHEFTKDDTDQQEVQVKLKSGKLVIRGRGVSGWYKKEHKLKYDGEPLQFYISPTLLIQLVNKYVDCRINPSALLVDGGRFKYVTGLSAERNGDAREELPRDEEPDEPSEEGD